MWWTGVHVGFGGGQCKLAFGGESLNHTCLVSQRVLGDGLLVVRKIENVQSGAQNRPKLACVISECGEM